MNQRIDSPVWNRALGCVTVASKLAKQRGGGATRKEAGACRRSLLAAALLLACVMPVGAIAGETCTGPTGQSATGITAFACGPSADASGNEATALGDTASGETSMALGYNVAAGTQDHDAVNVSQLTPFATTIGGGAAFTGGAFTAPTFNIQSTDYHDVGNALHALDTSVSDLYTKVGTSGTQGPKGDAGVTGPQGPAGGGGNSDAIAYDDSSHTRITLDAVEGGAPTRVSNVANGTSANDAVNVSQLDAQTQEALQTTNTYANTVSQQTLNQAESYTDQAIANYSSNLAQFEQQTNAHFQQVDKRINQVGATAPAWAGLPQNVSGTGANSIGVGFGSQGGRQALAVGYKRSLGKRARFSFGGSASGDDHSVSAGVGFHL